MRAAEWYGLRGRGLSLDVEHLQFLPAGSILHWEFNHFVVFERRHQARRRDRRSGHAAAGRSRAKSSATSFTGVALVFEPTDTFTAKRRGSGRSAGTCSQLAGQRHVLSRVVVTSLLLRVFALALPLVTAVIVDRVSRARRRACSSSSRSASAACSCSRW